MNSISFSREEKAILVRKIQSYFSDELDRTIGDFQAGFLLDFFAEEIGPYYYNSALRDAQAVLDDRMDGLREALYEIEKPTEFDR